MRCFDQNSEKGAGHQYNEKRKMEPKQSKSDEEGW